MTKKGIYGLTVAVFFTVALTVKSQNVYDGFCIKENIPTKKLPQDASVVERDVMWEKRVWRVIDNREKINFPLYYPLEATTQYRSLWDIIRYHLTEEIGSLTPYRNFNEAALSEFGGDQFLYPVLTTDADYLSKVNELITIRGDEPVVIQTINEFGEVVDSCKGYDANGECILAYTEPEFIKIESKDIVAWEIKEDWFFDKQRSVMDVRIMGIAPIVQYTDPVTRQVAGHKRLLWLYYPELRYILQNYPVFNRNNDAMNLSFDDLFRKRLFNSYIKKESNIYDRKITDYVSGVDALLESERIKNEMFEMEHDVWDL